MPAFFSRALGDLNPVRNATDFCEKPARRHSNPYLTYAVAQEPRIDRKTRIQARAARISVFLKKRKPIFPLLYGRADLRRFLDGQLEHYQYLDFRRGGYAQKQADLVAGLLAVGVPLHEAPEAAPEQLHVRRGQLLGEPVRPRWGQVFTRIPGWSLAWGIGWAIFWVILAIFALVSGSDVQQPWFLPVGGFVGGVDRSSSLDEHLRSRWKRRPAPACSTILRLL